LLVGASPFGLPNATEEEQRRADEVIGQFHQLVVESKKMAWAHTLRSKSEEPFKKKKMASPTNQNIFRA
jgi:hypothetical protein